MMCFERKKCWFWLMVLPLGYGSVDPNIFADPDPGRQNVTVPDPKHSTKIIIYPMEFKM